MFKIILIPSYEPDNKLIDLVKSIDTSIYKIIIVNDGSNNKYNKVFDQCKMIADVLEYKKNMGKGYALKYGMKYIKDKYKKDYIIVTMDSDGQHKIGDAIKLINYVEYNPYTLVLGKRIRNKNTPLRSKLGNEITKFIYKVVTKINVYDTQTGLRAFSDKLVDFLLNVKGDRFEYEMNCLLDVAKNNIKIKEIKIETIYIEDNKSSHFNTLKDSYLIYKDIIKFSLSSITSFLIDYMLFILFSLIFNIVISNIIARVISANINFFINKKYVFKCKNNLLKSIISYMLLAIFILLVNTFLLNLLVTNFLLNKYIAKVIVEIIMFILSYLVQKNFIFKKVGDYEEI